MMNEVSKEYVEPPATLPGFPKAEKTKPKSRRKRWIDKDSGDILEWDYMHGKLERFNKRGKHKGEYDPATGNQTKPVDPSKNITPTMWKKSRKVMQFVLAWYHKTDDAFVGEVLLKGATESDVREAFGLSEDEYPGDCLGVTEAQKGFLRRLNRDAVQLDEFDYFVEVQQHSANLSV